MIPYTLNAYNRQIFTTNPYIIKNYEQETILSMCDAIKCKAQTFVIQATKRIEEMNHRPYSQLEILCKLKFST